MPDPGEVFYLPPDADEPAGKGNRPYLLLSDCRPSAELATLALGSTRGSDAAFGAEHVRVDPSASTYRRTGLARPTYIYTSRLVTASPDALRNPAGSLMHVMGAVRASLSRALGLGTGVTREPNVPGANRRGRLVRLSRNVEAEWETSHALVVTEPEYSRFGYRQTVVPLFGGSFEAYELDVVLPDDSWDTPVVGQEVGEILAVPAVATLYLPRDIAAFLDVVVPPGVMEAVDRALVAHFGLHEHG
jgi:hypothetical protein